jgi:hypothetical protein
MVYEVGIKANAFVGMMVISIERELALLFFGLTCGISQYPNSQHKRKVR